MYSVGIFAAGRGFNLRAIEFFEASTGRWEKSVTWKNDSVA
jgi:hypothetical protein